MMILKARLRELGYGSVTPTESHGNRGNCGNRRDYNGLAVPMISGEREPMGTSNPLKSLRFPQFPEFPSEILGAEHAQELPWWCDPAGVRARFDEIAGRLEFQDGFSRDEAEELARDCLIEELIAVGLVRENAMRAGSGWFERATWRTSRPSGRLSGW
jgi:hypothetical protein